MIPNVALYVVTDNRLEYLRKTLTSFHDNCDYPFAQKVIVNDNGFDKHVKESVDELAKSYGFTDTIHHDRKKGFSGVYRTAWATVRSRPYSFGLENDFTFNEKVDIRAMIDILEWNRNLAQVSLKRQAWSDEEKSLGGFIEKNPASYEDKEIVNLKWCEHRNFFTTNPNLSPRNIIERGWPPIDNSEGYFSINLFKNPNIKCAILGHKFDAPKVEHIGYNRTGVNY